ncbi:hypothetical protein [Isoptericola variabilis]|uniref:Secreted protein n=1 Tax=Isoptericola variabilis (strain 225) TaxID=743718 RepID=F6FQQ6_ISOV2|nr:hypothetical protein [Isoptericola variabilis]AEG42871.1 hypothetical protein Isova_0053 [Isoptericola variabilis 225]TWH31011.1 hypothetical protein L600_002700000350 [Isoptericola variabilis J7]
MKRVLITSVTVLGLVVGGAAAAQAGETNGRGDPIPGAHTASSACAFSGQDRLDALENQPPEFNDDHLYGFRERGRVQSYGMYVKNGLKGVVPSPGIACRGNVEFEE